MSYEVGNKKSHELSVLCDQWDLEKVDQLFRQFDRLGQEAGAERGIGIDLVVTKQMIERMGGSIHAESVMCAGSEF